MTVYTLSAFLFTFYRKSKRHEVYTPIRKTARENNNNVEVYGVAALKRSFYRVEEWRAPILKTAIKR